MLRPLGLEVGSLRGPLTFATRAVAQDSDFFRLSA